MRHVTRPQRASTMEHNWPPPSALKAGQYVSNATSHIAVERQKLRFGSACQPVNLSLYIRLVHHHRGNSQHRNTTGLSIGRSPMMPKARWNSSSRWRAHASSVSVRPPTGCSA